MSKTPLKRNIDATLSDPNESPETNNRKITRTVAQICEECGILASSDCGDPDNLAIACKKCLRQYHIQCMQFNRSAFIMRQVISGNFRWACYICQLKTMDSVELISSKLEVINTTFTKLTKQITDLTKLTSGYEMAVHNINSRLEAVEASINQGKINVDANLSHLRVSKAGRSEVNELRETIEQMKIEMNEIRMKLDQKRELA